MVYNNPPIYRTDVTPEILTALAGCETIVAFKDSSGDTRRFTDVRNRVGDRFVLFAGLDDVVMESVMVGAVGWVSGLSNAFPARGRDAVPPGARRAATARPCRSMSGSCRCCISMPGPISCNASSSARRSWAAAVPSPVRRDWPLAPDERAEVEVLMERALAARPRLPDVGLAA